MKKKLLLILVLSLLLVGNVDAATKYTSFEATLHHGGSVSIPIGATASSLLYEDGSTAKYTSYTSYKNYFTVAGDTKQYEAYCIDPGMGVSDGDKYKCELLSEKNYPMIYAAIDDIASFKSNWNVTDIIFRTLGIMERNSVVYSSGGNLGEFNTKKNNVVLTINWHKAVEYAAGPIHPANVDYVPSGDFATARTYLNKYSKYWIGNPAGHVAYTPKATSSSTMQSGTCGGSSCTGQYFQLTQVGDKKDNRWRVTTKGGVKATNVQIKGQTGTTVYIEQKWNGTSAVFTLATSGTNCDKGKAVVTGVIPGAASTSSADDTPYICTTNGSKQSFVTLMPGDTGDKFDSIPVQCNKCKEHTSYKPEEKQKNKSKERVEADQWSEQTVKLCCLDNGGKSTLEELKLDKLFLDGTNDYLKVDNYTNKCNNSIYVDAELQKKLEQSIDIKVSSERVATYCNVYCTEKIEVTVPGAVASASGKYFKLDGKPHVYGEKRCRIKIDYRTLRAKYEKSVIGRSTDKENSNLGGTLDKDGEVYWFNEYQREHSYVEMMDGKTKNEGGGKIEHSVSFADKKIKFKKKVCKKSTTVGKGAKTYSSSNDSSCSDLGSSGVCDKDSCPSYEDDYKYDYGQPDDCKTKYDVWVIDNAPNYVSCNGGTPGRCEVEYWQIEYNPSFKFTANSFDGLEIKVKNGSKKVWYYQKTKYNLDTSDCDTSVQNEKNEWAQDKWEYDSGGDFSNDQYESRHKSYQTANFESEYNKHNSASNTAMTKFKTNKNMATTMENIAKGCEEFLEKKPAAYNIHPSANFHFLLVYLDGDKNKVGPEFTVPYGSSSCGMSYDTKYKTSTIFNGPDKEAKGMGDVKNMDTKTIRSAGETVMDTPVSYKRYITYDLYYKMNCDWPDSPANIQKTVYPKPTVEGYTAMAGGDFKAGVVSTGTGNRTAHKYQYSVYLTTFKGEYETYWDMQGLGSTNKLQKFVERFNRERNTCALQGNALSKGSAESLLDSPTTVPFTCRLDIAHGGMRIGQCRHGVDSSLPCDGPYPVNEVFEFRVVDPKDIFPKNQAFDAVDMAHNWKKSDNTYGPTWNNIQNNVAAKDETYSPSHLTYSFKLTTRAMNAIKKYNKTNSYNAFDDNMTCDSCASQEQNGCGTINPDTGSCMNGNTWKYACKKCKSKFLSEISGSSAKIGSTNIGQKVWNNSKGIDIIRNSSDIFWAK